MVVYPLRAQTELASGLRDAGSESLLRIGKTERAILGYEGAVDVVDVLGALAVGGQGVGTMTAPPCTTMRTCRRKERYSLSERSERACLSSLRVNGTSFTSFRAGTTGGGGCDIGAVRGTVTVMGMGTCMRDMMEP